MSPRLKKPTWLRRRLPTDPAFEKVRRLIGDGHLHTVCQEAKCPNIWECFSRQTATFLILGDRCSRNCRFCAVAHGPKGPPDPGEPAAVADAVLRMNLDYVVITSVTRDDLSDGGAGHFAKTIAAVRQKKPLAGIEVLIPDFQGNQSALSAILAAEPNVVNHNMETVRRLYPEVRPQADYDRSLAVIETLSQAAPAIPVKSGLMVGLGETKDELVTTFENLIDAGCRLLTIGQYLQPSRSHLDVQRYLPPEEFDELKSLALSLGFTHVASGPFVRSSYHAKDMFQKAPP
jgi:lipoic acid synthetase